MLNALIRTRMAALFSSIGRRSRIGAKQRSTAAKIGVALLTVYIIGVFLFLFGSMFFTLCHPLCDAGLGWFYFALAGLMGLMLGVIGNLFMAQAQLFEARDNDLLLSMPIPPRYILASRMVLLYLLALMYASLALLPAGAIYLYSYPATAAMVLCFLAVWLLLPLLALVFSCFLGWLVALLSARMRRKNLVTTVLSLALMALYFIGYSRIQTYLNVLIARGAELADAMRRSLPPLYRLGAAVFSGDFLSLLLFALWVLLPFALLYILLSRSFLRLVTTKHTVARLRYRERALSVTSPRRALAYKELRHFSANAMYMLNAALGVAFMVALPVVLLVKRAALFELLSAISLPSEYLGAGVALAVCMLASTVIISAASVSLEGKNLWIVRTSPVPSADILCAKAEAHILVGLPAAVFSGLASALLLGVPALHVLFAAALPAAMTCFMAVFGVAVNLAFPRLDYINEVAAVKSSIATMIVMFGGMAAVGLPALVYFILLADKLSITAFLAIDLLLLSATAALLCREIRTKGAQRFAEL